jgi:hypothetical protein
VGKLANVDKTRVTQTRNGFETVSLLKFGTDEIVPVLN